MSFQPDEYGPQYEKWELSHLPIMPKVFKTKPIERSKPQYDIVKAQLQRDDITEVVCATDAGREGELIFRLVYEDAKWHANQALMDFITTDSAIKDG